MKGQSSGENETHNGGLHLTSAIGSRLWQSICPADFHKKGKRGKMNKLNWVADKITHDMLYYST